MGGGTKTISNIQTVNFMEDTAAGTLRKKLMMSVYESVPGGSNAMIKMYGEQIAQMKGLYNDEYLANMGYMHDNKIYVKGIDKSKVLEWVFSNVDSSAFKVASATLTPMTRDIAVFLALQEFDYWEFSSRSFYRDLGSGVSKYYYNTSVYNGPYIDVNVYRNSEDTIREWAAGESVVLPNSMTFPTRFDMVVGVANWRFTHGSEVYYVPVEFEVIQVVNSELSSTTAFANSLAETATKVHNKTFANGVYDTATPYMYTYTVTTSVVDMYSINYSINVTSVYNNGSILWGPIPVPVDDPVWDTVYSIELDRVKKSIDLFFKDTRSLYCETYTTDEDVNGNLYTNKRVYFIDEYTQFVGDIETSSMPIIALKQHGELVDNTEKLKCVLNKIGFARDDFTDSLKDPNLKSAYLWFNTGFEDRSEVSSAAMFELLYALGESNITTTTGAYGKLVESGKRAGVELSFPTIDYKMSSQLTLKVSQGVLAGGVKYMSESSLTSETVTEWYDGGDQGWFQDVVNYSTAYKYSKQITENQYVTITAFDIRIAYTVHGFTKEYNSYTNAVGELANLRVPVLRYSANKLTYDMYLDIIEASMGFIAYSSQTVKTKWYQGGFIKFLVMAVAIYTGNVWAMALSMFASFGGMEMLGDIGGPVAAIAMALYTIYDILYQGGTMTVANAAVLASSTLSIVTTINSFFFTMRYEELTDRVSKAEDEADKADKEYSGLMEGIIGGGNMFRSNSGRNIDDYYRLAVGDFDQYNVMYNSAYNFNRLYPS